MTAASQPTRAERFARNLAWSGIGQAGSLALSFALIPYIIRQLGNDGYAVYGLMGQINGYLMLLSFGAGTATVKYVSELHGRKDELGEILGASFLLQVGLVSAGALALWFARWRLVHFFNVPPSWQPAAAWMFGCAALAALFGSAMQWSLAVLQGLQRYDISNATSLGQSTLLVGGAALLLWLRRPASALGTLFLALSAVFAALALSVALRRLAARPSFAAWRSGRRWREVLRYGLAAFTAQLAWSAAFQWDKVFISHYGRLSELTFYLVPSFILQKLLMVTMMISGVAFPMLSELHGQADREAMARVYRKCSEGVLWATIPGLALLMVLGPQLFTLWLGPEFSLKGTWPMRLLLVGYLAYFLDAMLGAAYLGSGRVRLTLLADVVQMLLCCLFWRLLVPRYGILGAAAGFALGMTLIHVPFVVYVNRLLFGIGVGEYFRFALFRPLAACVFLIALLAPCRPFINGWPALIGVSVIGIIVYYSAGFWLLDKEGRDGIRFMAHRLLRIT